MQEKVTLGPGWVYLAMPKCASTSVRQHVQRLGVAVHKHDYNGSILDGFKEITAREDLERVRLFTTIRNPINRAYSAWMYLKAGGSNAEDKRDAHTFIRHRETFDEFVARAMRYPIPAILQQKHFRPMTSWMYPNGETHLEYRLLDVNDVRRGLGTNKRYRKGEYNGLPVMSIDTMTTLQRVYFDDCVMYGRYNYDEQGWL